MNEATVWPQNGADRRAVEALRIQSCHLDQKRTGNREVSGSFFVSFAQNAVFGAFFMQRMCNFGERAKDAVPYPEAALAES